MDEFLLKKSQAFTAFKAAMLVSVAAFLLPVRLFAQAPVISYNGPRVFTDNTAVSLAPASSNVAAPGYSSGVILGSGLTFNVNYVAVDAAGNMYVNDIESGVGEVKKITADGSSTTIIGSGFLSQSAGVAVDKYGNVFVTDQSTVWKIPANGSPVSYGTPVIINNTFSRPFAVAVDTAGFVYVTDLTAGGVYKMAGDGSGKTRVDDGSFSNGAALTVNIAGNVYAANYSTGVLYEIPVNTSTPIPLASGFAFPRGMAVDGGGTIYVDDEGASSILTVPPGGGTPFPLITGLSNLVGLAIDANYNLYGCLQGAGGITKFSPQGGYFISPALPPGLTINATTGVISGTPTTAFGPIDYAVTAFNASGSDADTVTLSAGPPPVISYATPQTYTAGTTISPLAPSSTGAAVSQPAYASTPFNVSSGFGSPAGIAKDGAGNLYVADKINNNIIELPAGGGSPITITASLNGPTGVAVDKAGNIYVADSQNGVVKRISSDLSSITTVGSGFTEPINVALDPTGNLFVADAGAEIIYEIEATTGKQSYFTGGFEDLSGLATDAAGNLYVTDESAGTLYKFTSRSNLALTFASMFNFPTGVAVDASGNIFVTDGNGEQVYEIPGGNGAPIAIGSGFGFPADAVVDGAGNVYVTDAGPNVLYKLSPKGGYYIDKPLPRGLKLNDTTGVISGTPKAVSAAANYTVTAYAAQVAGASSPLNITVNPAQPPAISYATPQIFTAGMAATVSPSNTGGKVASIGYSDNITVLGSGFSGSMGTAVDSHGNVYVADNLNNLVKKIPAGGGTPVTIGGTSFSEPAAVAVDSTGNVYVADEGNSQIVEIPAAGGANIILGSGFSAPNGVAVDTTGNVFVTDEANNAVYMIPKGGGSPSVVATGTFVELTGIAVDAADNLYVADGGSSTVFKFTAGNYAPSLLPDFFDYPTGVSVDAAGNVYVADQGPNVIYRIPSDNSGQYTIASQLNNPQGIAVDGAGNLYIADTDNNDIEEVSPNGGYFVNRALPRGLSFSSSNGKISGTPTTVSPSASYLVSAYNTGGVSQAALSITVNLPPPPTVSYTTPQVFVQNTAISPVFPTSTNVGAPAYFSTAGTIGSGLGLPFATATDQNGNVYIADATTSSIYKILKDGTQTTVGTGLSNPVGVAVDKNGNIYSVNGGDNSVVEIHAGSGTQTPIGGGFMIPTSIAVDSSGTAYVIDQRNTSLGSAVYRVRPGQSKQIFKTGFSYPTGIAVDSQGNVYVSDGGSGSASHVYIISPDGSSESALNSHFSQASGVAVDATGNIFVSDFGAGDVIEFPAGNGPKVIIKAGLTVPYGLSADGAGNVYVADPAVDDVSVLKPAGGYFISPVLPAGLSMNAATGIITGTPTVASPAKNYTVKVYNYGGSDSTAINIHVLSTNAALSRLVPGRGTLSPAFNTDSLNYIDSVAFNVPTIKLTPVVTDTTARVTINGSAVPSGTASQSIQLNAGPNVITTVVTAEDGVTTRSYITTVVKAPSPVALIQSLTLSNGTLSPSFTMSNKNYTANVSNLVTSINVKAALLDSTATIKVNGVPVANKVFSQAIALLAGPNTITVTTKAQDSIASETYTVVVTRAPSVNALLAGLTMSNGTLNPGFTRSGFSYNASVTNLISSITIKPTLVDSTATIKVNGVPVTNKTFSSVLPLNVGPNTLRVVVKAQDSTTTQTYTVVVTRAGSSQALLAGLALSNGTLSPSFNATNTGYTASVLNNITTITVKPSLIDTTATIKVNNVLVANKTFSQAIPLNVGPNTITVVSKAQDGSTTKTYIITVTRGGSSQALLSKLQPSNGVLSPTFTYTGFNYTASVLNNVPSITITPTLVDNTATIKVNGLPVTSGTASQSIPLSVGPNAITVTTKAQDSTTTKTYTVVVTRAGSSQALLSKLHLSKGTLSPTFTYTGYSYTASVGNSVSSLTVTASLVDPTATMKVNGTPLANDGTTSAIPLSVGDNTITITTKAQDSVTTKTYTVVVTRAGTGGSGVVFLPAVTQSFKPDLAANVVVHQALSPNGDGQNDVLTIDNIESYPDNKLQIMNQNGQLIYEAKGYDNASKVFDGHSNKNGQLQLPGTYFYSLEYKVNGETKHTTGYIVLKY